jgi:hypothetical protein
VFKKIAGVLVLTAGVAFADEEPPPAVTGAAATATAGWSDQIIDNGLVMPASDLGLYGDLEVHRTTYTQAPIPPANMGIIVHNTAFNIVAGAGYGVTELITLGGQYTLPVADADGAFSNAGRLTGFGGYSISRDDKLALVAGADITVDFAGSATGILHAGVSLRYKVAPKVVVYTGNPLAPGPYGEQLVVGLNNSSPVAIDLPVGVGFQANPKLFAWAETQLAHIKIANTANQFFGADILPLQIGALFRAVKDVDVGGFADIDFENISSFYAIGVMARYYKHHGK